MRRGRGHLKQQRFRAESSRGGTPAGDRNQVTRLGPPGPDTRISFPPPGAAQAIKPIPNGPLLRAPRLGRHAR